MENLNPNTEQSTTPVVSVPHTDKPRNTHTRLIALSGIALFLAGTASYVYVHFYTNPGSSKIVSTQGMPEDVRSAITELTFDDVSPDSTTETVFGYIDEINAALEDETLNQTERMTLLLKKARAQSAIRGGMLRGDAAGGAGMVEAVSILESLYMTAPENDQQALIQAGTIPVYLHLLISSCFIPELAYSLPDEYDEFYQELRGTEDSFRISKAASILAFREFAYNELPPEYENDLVTVTWRSYISAVYLAAFPGWRDGEEEDAREAKIYADLKADVDRFDSLRPILVTGKTKTEIEPLIYSAFAYDIARTYKRTNPSSDNQARITQRYEEALAAADKIENDDTSKAFYKAIVATHYLNSLYRRYTPEERDQEKVDELVGVFMENFAYNKDTMTVFTSYLEEGITPRGLWMPIRATLYEVAKENPEFRTFIAEKAGIEL